MDGNQAPEAEKAKTKSGGGFTVVIGRFVVKGGAVDLVDRDGRHAATFTDVNMTYTSLTETNVEGTAVIGRVVWAETVTLENVRTPFKYAAGELTLPELTGTLAGGPVRGSYRAQPDAPKSPFETEFTFEQVNLDRLASQAGWWKPGQASGVAAGRFALRGDMRRAERAEGSGQFQLRDGQFKQLEFLQSIGQLLNIRELSDLRLKDARGEFRVGGEKLTFDQLTLTGANLQLDAKGTVRFDSKVALDARLGVEEGLVKQLPDLVRSSFATSGSGVRTIDFNITGSTDKLRTNLLDKLIGQKIGQQFDELLTGIFGRGNKEEEKREERGGRPEEGGEKSGEKGGAEAEEGSGQGGCREDFPRSGPTDDGDHAREAVRVIAGTAGGIPLQTPRTDLRPTMDVVKGAIFSSLGDLVTGARVLDLFAGSGSLGIEALSRGAASVTFVESERRAVAAIGKNLEKTQLTGPAATVQEMDVFRFIDRFAATASYEIILADPPYAKAEGERDFAPELLCAPMLRNALTPGGIFVLEHLPGAKLKLGNAWECFRQKRYGATEVAFLRALPA